VASTPISDIPFPSGTNVMLVVRGTELVAARGDTVLQPEDHVYVFCRPEDVGLVGLLFGGQEGA
jgi:cell volume regulation protein A